MCSRQASCYGDEKDLQGQYRAAITLAKTPPIRWGGRIDRRESEVNKEELVKLVADRTRMTQKDTQAMLMTTLEAIGHALSRGDRVTLVGFGTFQVRERAAREGRNPRTGAVLRIPAKKSPVFVAGKALREKVKTGPRKAAVSRR